MAGERDESRTRAELAKARGNRIALEIQKRGMTQSSLAHEANIRQSQISDWINGKILVTESSLKTLAAVLGVTVEYLASGEGPEAWKFGEIFPTKKAFWEANITQIIREASQVVIITNFEGPKQAFWQALKERAKKESAFQLFYLMLEPHGGASYLMNQSMGFMGAPEDFDVSMIADLSFTMKQSNHHANKMLKFKYWDGAVIAPGPLLSWTIAGKETIALGLWLTVPELAAADDVPYIVVSGGHLFDWLKRHYKALIENAKDTRHSFPIDSKAFPEFV